MPSTTALSPGDVAFAEVDFSDQGSSKKRPVVVLGPRTVYGDFACMALTSVENPGDIPVNDWESAGLSSPSWVRPTLAMIEETAMGTRLGMLSRADKRSIAAMLRKMIAPVFFAQG